MRTVPAYTARHYRNRANAHVWIAKIVSGSSTWLFGTGSVILTDGPVYPLLDPSSWYTRETVDPMRKTWSINELKLTIYNKPYRNTGGNEIRFGQECGALNNAAVTLYLIAGLNPTALTDGMTLFDGVVKDNPDVTFRDVTILVTDGLSVQDIVILQTYVTGLYNAVPVEWRARKVPVVYGEHKFTRDKSVDTGLVRCELAGSEDARIYVAAGHVCHSMTEGFIMHDEVPHPSSMISPTLDNDDGGLATAKMSGDADAFLYAENSDIGEWNFHGNYSKTLDCGNLGDMDIRTKAYAIRSITGLQGVDMAVGFRDFANNEFNIMTPIGKILGVDESGTYYGYLKFKCAIAQVLQDDFDPEVTLESGLYGIDLNISTFLNNANITAKFDIADWMNTLWHLRSGDSTYTAADRPLLVRIYYNGTLQSGDVNVALLWLYYCYLQIRYRPYKFSSAWVACKGRVYGSWITANGRSCGYAPGDLIEDPAHIIESLFRDEMGLVDADIDIASFDSALNANVKARIQINSDTVIDGKPPTVLSTCKQITEQSTFLLIVSSASKARLVPLNVASPTVARTIHAEEINLETFHHSKYPDVMNKINYETQWMEQWGVYLTTANQHEDNSINSDIGLREWNVKWPNICGSSATHVAVHLAYTLWSGLHDFIQMDTFGVGNADLERGDWISLDAGLDDLVDCYGSSWASKKFLIIDITQRENSTHIEAVQLV